MCGGQTRCAMAGATEESLVNDRETTGEPSFPRHACCDRPPSARLRPSRRQLGRSSPSLVGRRRSSGSLEGRPRSLTDFGRSLGVVEEFS